jgi:Uma2 family endonuclease
MTVITFPRVMPDERAPKQLFSLAEYLEKEERSKTKHHFFNGQIVRMPGAKFRHNEITTNVLSALKNAVKGLNTTFRVCNSDQKIIIEHEETLAVVYPDAMVICEKPIFWNGREDLITNPLVVVEVLSTSTRKYDKGDKFLLYKKCATLKEYVTIEQNKPHIESWYRLSETTWDNTAEEDLSKSFSLRAIGVSIALSDIYEHIEF